MVCRTRCAIAIQFLQKDIADFLRQIPMCKFHRLSQAAAFGAALFDAESAAARRYRQRVVF